jgi:hypothetical protein
MVVDLRVRGVKDAHDTNRSSPRSGLDIIGEIAFRHRSVRFFPASSLSTSRVPIFLLGLGARFKNGAQKIRSMGRIILPGFEIKLWSAASI